MVGDIKKEKYVYYHCTGYKGKCPEKYVREEEVARQMEAALFRLKAKEELIPLLVRAQKEMHAQESKFHGEAVAKLQAERDALESRLEALYLDKLDKVITPEFFAAKSREWSAKLEDLRAQIDRHGAAHVNYINEAIELLELLQDAIGKYREWERAEKRRLLQSVLSNSIWMNATLTVTFRQPFESLAVMNEEAESKIAPSVAGEGDSVKWWSQGESNS